MWCCQRFYIWHLPRFFWGELTICYNWIAPTVSLSNIRPGCLPATCNSYNLRASHTPHVTRCFKLQLTPPSPPPPPPPHTHTHAPTQNTPIWITAGGVVYSTKPASSSQQLLKNVGVKQYVSVGVVGFFINKNLSQPPPKV